MDKKGIEMSMNTLVVAIIVLVVLIVIIGIFTGTIGNIAKKFNSQTDTAGEQSDEAMNSLDFFSCENGKMACRTNDVYICRDSKWEIYQKCEDGCKENSCK